MYEEKDKKNKVSPINNYQTFGLIMLFCGLVWTIIVVLVVKSC